MTDRIFTDFHLFCGAGGGALGFSWASRTYGSMRGRFRSLGGVDSHPRRCADFGLLLGRPATCMDLFSAEDYAAFHGKAPPDGWREATPADIRAAAGGERPDVVFTSAPCKSFSGLLSAAKAETPKYKALSTLTVRGIWLALEAWADDPPGFIVFENVPRIVQRGAHLLDQIVGLLQAYGYAVHKDAHDCGELGGLAQHRQRFLLLARHIRRVRPFLYKPELQRVRAIGEVVGPMLMPEDEGGGPMHRLPRLKAETLVRLALITAGKDWRALKSVDHTQLRMVPVGSAGPKFNNCFRIVDWREASPAVTGGAGPSSGGLAVADPRVDSAAWHHGALGVQRFDGPSGAISGHTNPANGAFAIADPRPSDAFGEHGGKLQVDGFDAPARTVTGSRVGSGALLVADPRVTDVAWRGGVMGVLPFDKPSGAVAGRNTPTNGAFTVADPRLEHTASYGQLGVKPWDSPASTVTAQSLVGGGAHAVADPRLRIEPRNGVLGVQAWDRAGATVTASLDVQAGPAAVQDPRAPAAAPLVIIAQDGTWHRPLTALELAALQSLPLTVNGAPLAFHGSPTEWREAIGNMVPPRSAQAIAEVLLDTLLQEAAGVTFSLGGGGGIWVNPDDAVGRALGWQA